MKPKINKKLATLVLDPERWLRGEGSSASMLLRTSDGKMCCLGFECIRRGATVDSIERVKIPSGVRHPKIRPRSFQARERELGNRTRELAIADINDTDRIPLNHRGDLARVRKLRPLFEKLGVRLVLGRER